MYTDLPVDELHRYRSAQTEPDDFDAFWATTLDESRRRGGAPSIERVDAGLRTIEVFDVSFPGFDGEPVRAWLRRPAGSTEPLPCVVEYVGYGGGRGLAIENLLWSSAGFAHLHVDTRGQGSAWSLGDTPDSGGS
ncbi:MAG TPA: acetylxylan esterase, partial [Pseudolysinimonas sp.]|nr:acetylxylan esterase [Pseudolysinimonas sp.]